jgi:exodeoxyribonuclease V alpha subunit
MLDRSPLYYRADPQKAIRDLSGIGFKLAKKIIEELGEGDPHTAFGVIERNPFDLIEVDGIGFKKADKIALTDFSISSDDVRRHHAGNRAILETAGVLTERLFAAERV